MMGPMKRGSGAICDVRRHQSVMKPGLSESQMGLYLGGKI